MTDDLELNQKIADALIKMILAAEFPGKQSAPVMLRFQGEWQEYERDRYAWFGAVRSVAIKEGASGWVSSPFRVYVGSIGDRGKPIYTYSDGTSRFLGVFNGKDIALEFPLHEYLHVKRHELSGRYRQTKLDKGQKELVSRIMSDGFGCENHGEVISLGNVSLGTEHEQIELEQFLHSFSVLGMVREYARGRYQPNWLSSNA